MLIGGSDVLAIQRRWRDMNRYVKVRYKADSVLAIHGNFLYSMTNRTDNTRSCKWTSKPSIYRVTILFNVITIIFLKTIFVFWRKWTVRAASIWSRTVRAASIWSRTVRAASIWSRRKQRIGIWPDASVTDCTLLTTWPAVSKKCLTGYVAVVDNVFSTWRRYGRVY